MTQDGALGAGGRPEACDSRLPRIRTKALMRSLVMRGTVGGLGATGFSGAFCLGMPFGS